MYEPFSWSDSAYKVNAGTYIQEIIEHNYAEDLFFSFMYKKWSKCFRHSHMDPGFFDYHFQVMLESEFGETKWRFQKELLNHQKLALMKQELASFLEKKVMAALPVRPSDNDEFFLSTAFSQSPFFFNKQQRKSNQLFVSYRKNIWLIKSV
ncbi:DUF6138 family protein [Lysinibacillus sp. MHQ-1]|nr:DUF6138 family protein [Lysinibacillus sp. MHQ-1]